MIGVARQAIADDFGVDLRAALLGVFILLKDDDSGALPHDEAVAVLIVRTRRLLRFVIEVGAERPRLGETGDPDRADGRLGAAGKHDVGVIVLDHAGCIANRVGTG
jgi:hypothetical protein